VKSHFFILEDKSDFINHLFTELIFNQFVSALQDGMSLQSDQSSTPQSP